MQHKEEEGRENARETGKFQRRAEDTDAEVSAEAETPVAFVPQNLPAATIDIEIPLSISQNIETSDFDDVDTLPESFISVVTGATSSPTLSISTISDFTPTELGEDIEHVEEKAAARHDAFYFEDGNVEIICGSTVFRVHSTVVSFSSPKLRDILSQLTLRHAPTPGECPRVTISDSAEDFAVLLKMIYTPGFPSRHEAPEFTVFASLLRMTTKYGFSSVRDQLVKDIRGAYPTKWEDFQGAKVLGENFFGSPKPHPNAVLNLFETEKVRFAVPFAAYRASIGGFSALVSDKPGTALPPRTLATAINGMHVLRAAASNFAHMAVYVGFLRVCSNESCTLNVEIGSVEKRVIAMEKVCSAVIGQREGGLLSPPPSGHLLCTKCAKHVEMTHAIWAPDIWKKLPPAFNISRSWDDL
ncbi:hypothetical protein BJ322DRAFT_142702 [Thelephora terrestris]|uniref:BTB domain-containing protein n=1 Tax=Thelephora terrestris TaxID=56493 RepID=A0A9P6HBK1_9AGAM|nr:hypothetical protein BJ322DRAFT_142702 [Thelephora terrestris]